MRITEGLWDIFDRTVTIMMVAAVALMLLDTLAVTLMVVLRYIFSTSIDWLFEVIEYSLLAITVLPMAWVMRNNGHIRMELVITRLNPRQAALVSAIGSVVGVALLAVVTWYTAALTAADFQSGVQISSILRPPRWTLEFIMPIGFLVLLIQVARNGYMYLAEWRSSSDGRLTLADNAFGGER